METTNCETARESLEIKFNKYQDIFEKIYYKYKLSNGEHLFLLAYMLNEELEKYKDNNKDASILSDNLNSIKDFLCKPSNMGKISIETINDAIVELKSHMDFKILSNRETLLCFLLTTNTLIKTVPSDNPIFKETEVILTALISDYMNNLDKGVILNKLISGYMNNLDNQNKNIN